MRTKLKLKWKLTLWGAFHLILLFLFYNLIQFSVLQSWVHNHEKDIIRKNMEEVVAYLELIEPGGKLADSRDFLAVLNERYQMIRIVDESGTPVVSVSDQMPANGVPAAYGASESLESVATEGDTLLLYRKPIRFASAALSVEIVRNPENFESLLHLIASLLVVTSFVSIALSLVGGRLLSYQLLSPINDMIRTMKGIREKGLKERVQIGDHRDELTELSTMFNELMDNLSHSFDQQQRFIEDASHELKTPLSIIHGHLSLIKRWGKDDPAVLERSIQLSLNETNRMIQMVSELLVLTRIDEDASALGSGPEQIRVKPALEEIVENFQTVHRQFEIRARLELDEEASLPIRKSHLQQILIIVLDNAIKYAGDVKRIEVTAAIENGQLRLAVKDYGTGIPADELPLVTNRFYRVDKSRSRKQGGNGLGLAIASRLLDLYGGDLKLGSLYGEWTEAVIRIPARGEQT
ncbi:MULTISPECIES: HAMP domain-containing sensor histidine kinase [Saccharibacillus]|uniref:HAMP domain-containing sensor histidine kinase n=1 Tax=Saccharibacillus TaxID=456492 RepID=UPI0012386EE3|nr:HAMP domain-containing protein [Saccharibacillus sp. WB 17]